MVAHRCKRQPGHLRPPMQSEKLRVVALDPKPPRVVLHIVNHPSQLPRRMQYALMIIGRILLPDATPARKNASEMHRRVRQRPKQRKAFLHRQRKMIDGPPPVVSPVFTMVPHGVNRPPLHLSFIHRLCHNSYNELFPKLLSDMHHQLQVLPIRKNFPKI